MERRGVGAQPVGKDGVLVDAFDFNELLKVAIEVFRSLLDELLVGGGSEDILLWKARKFLLRKVVS